MAKKKDNSKRNIALGAAGLVASGLAVKNGKALGSLARKAYDATKRLGRKRGKYKKPAQNNTVSQKGSKNREELLSTKSKKSEIIKSRKNKLKERNALEKYDNPESPYDNLAKEYQSNKYYIGELKENKLRPNYIKTQMRKNSFEGTIDDVKTPSDELKYINARLAKADVFRELKAKPENKGLSDKQIYLKIKKQESDIPLKEEVKRLRYLNLYSKQLYLISDFTFK